MLRPGRWGLPPADGKRRWIRTGLIVVGAVAAVLLVVCGFYYVKFAHLIDARLGGEQRPIPRIYGRSFDVRAGQALTLGELQERLGDIGYAERPKPEHPGEFSVGGNAVVLMPRAGAANARAVRIEFARSPRPMVSRLTAVGGGAVDRVTIDAPLLSALASGEKRRYVPLAAIPRQMVQAVIAIEDRRFYEHPGVDPIGTIGALVTNIRGNKPYTVGGSTITQQVIKNEFLTPEKTWKRKISEQFMALVLETRLTKDQILELYLNQMIFGQRGPFEIHGVAEASRIFFGKDVSNITLAEAATVAGLLQSPSKLSPFRNPERAIERRNLVLKAMVDAGFLAKDVAQKAEKEPLGAEPRALENEAPYFVDYVSQLVDDISKDLLKKDAAVDVYTTVDLHLQRIAQEALADGLAQVDKQLSKKKQGLAQAALLAVDPRTGEILAMVGGRAYDRSQYNRAVPPVRRQPGSVFKPFVYLAAFEKMAETGSADLTPATVMVDEPTTFADGDKPPYEPKNYQNEYDGPITLRHALAHSRNIVAVKVAEQTGYDRVANLWNRLGVGTHATPVPAIALGVFEASALEIATAYSIFPNGGVERPLTAIMRIVENGQPKKLKPAAEPKTIARPETTFLVTNMLRSVLDEGTGAAARANGFTLNAAGKTGTTSDLRDAWFVGFTPELLTVVWVGFDNNQSIGLTGAQAALPMWTTFMKRALAGHGDRAFAVPDAIVFADVCGETGKLATPNCPKIVHEAFLPGTEPKQSCPVHGGSGLFGRLGQWLGRIIRR